MRLNKKYWQNLSDSQRKIIESGTITALALIVATIFGLTSCNVTRTITTESSSIQKGDTSVIIQTRTIESYNAQKNELWQLQKH